MKRVSYVLTIVFSLLVCAVLLTACSPAALDAPVGIAYEDGILTWNEVPHADRYVVEVDGVDVAEVRTCHYAFMAADGTIFRVAALSDAKRYLTSAYSEQYVYKASADTRGTLNAPTIYEVDGSGLVTWSYVVNASGYRVYLNGVVVATVQETRYVLEVPNTGAYSVQVQAVGGDAYRDSPRSAIFRVQSDDGKVKAPSLRAPTLEYNDVMYRLEWMSVPNAVGYAVYLNDVRQATIAAEDDTSREAVGNGYRYYYAPYINVRDSRMYVVALGDGERYADSAASQPIAFPLASAGLPTGLRTEVVDGTRVIAWDALRNVSGYRVAVRLEDGVTERYTTPVNSIRLVLPDGEYYVSVAGDGDGLLFRPTEYSAEMAVSYLGGSVAAERLSAPANPYVFDGALRFDAVPNVVGYRILVDTPYDDEQGQYTYYIEDTQWTLPDTLLGTVLTMYVSAQGEGAYADSLWSAGACYYPINDPAVEGVVEHQYPDYSVLAMPQGLRFFEGVVSWTESPDAAQYELVVDGVSTLQQAVTYTLADPSVAHCIKVRTVSLTENVLDSPYTAELWVEPLRLDAPAGLAVSGHSLIWEGVGTAAGYVVDVGGTMLDWSATMLDLERQLPYDGTYTLRVRALATYPWLCDSLWSATITYTVDYEEQGTEHKPYLLSTAEDLAMLREHPTAYFALDADIAVGEIAPMFDAADSFGGTLDGRGHSLTDIRLLGEGINSLWGHLYGATLRNTTYVFTSVSMNASAECGVLAVQAVQCSFEGVQVVATATAGRGFGTVGVSNGCTYVGCVADVHYTQTDPTAWVGGLIGSGRQDVLRECTVRGALSGGIYMGALVATAQDTTITACTVGGDTAFRYDVRDAYAGAVAKGSLSGCDVTVNALYVIQGNAYVGGALGYGAVDVVTAIVTMRLEGQAATAYMGGVVGYSQGLTVCTAATTIDITADLTAEEGRYLGGVVGFGAATLRGTVTGVIDISNTVSVGPVTGTQPIDPYAGWTVSYK